ncbi:MAG: molybdopterin-synthase adenylyltransferase MoeB [Microbacteriaceae bacterium]
MSFPALVEPGAELTAEAQERYARQRLLPGVDTIGQRRLANARVLVIGAGGLGSPVLQYLAAAGVGTIGIVDDDVVDLSNLQRQVIHTVADLGSSKVTSARDAVLALNPAINVIMHELHLDSHNCLEVFRGYDLIVDGADNFATRYLANDAATLLGVPYIWGAIYQFDGQVSVFWEDAPGGEGVGYRDVFPEPPAAGTVLSCAEAGVFGAMCGSIGSIMATEAIKLIVGIGKPLLGRLLTFDVLTGSWREVPVRRNPDRSRVDHLIDYDVFCGVADAVDHVAEISASELSARLGARENGEAEFVLIDVRDASEHAFSAIPGDVLIPYLGIIDGSARSQIPKTPVVLYCQTGVRSAAAATALTAAGWSDVEHLAGGIQSWSTRVSPAVDGATARG